MILIDVILTNKSELFKDCGVCEVGISDHVLVYRPHERTKRLLRKQGPDCKKLQRTERTTTTYGLIIRHGSVECKYRLRFNQRPIFILAHSPDQSPGVSQS